MADIFNEVDDELRQAQAAAAFKRFWPWVTGALAIALVVTLGVWGWRSFDAAQTAQGAALYDIALNALAKGRIDEADRGFGQAAAKGSAGYRALAMMQQAGVRLNRGKTAEAVALLEKAANTTRDPLIGDAARLEAALARMDAAPLSQTLNRLQPLAASDRPYRDLAREAVAMAKLAGGRPAEARSDFGALAILPDVSQGARARARAAQAMIDSGGAAVVPAAVAAELALPPAPPTPPAAALAAGPGAQ